jgi:hypothetical protein
MIDMPHHSRPLNASTKEKEAHPVASVFTTSSFEQGIGK